MSLLQALDQTAPMVMFFGVLLLSVLVCTLALLADY